MTNQEVEQIKGHFDKVSQEIRTELREEIAEVRHYTGVVAEDLRSEIRAVAEGVALANERINDVDLRVDSLTGRVDSLTGHVGSLASRVDGLTGEVRRGFAGVRAEIHRLHETDDELRRRIEAQEQRGA